MWVAVGIMCVCRWKLKFHLPDEDLRFFHGGYLWISKSLQVGYRKELHIRRERQNIRNWTAVEVVLGSILNASGSQKIIKRRSGVCIRLAILLPIQQYCEYCYTVQLATQIVLQHCACKYDKYDTTV